MIKKLKIPAIIVSILLIGVLFEFGVVADTTANAKVEPWGEVNGESVFLYTLTNSQDAKLKVTNYGARVTSLVVPDKEGNMVDVVLGFDSLEGYLKNHTYIGAIVGRYGNRIEDGKFTLDGKQYSLVTNNIGNHLHGGHKGFDQRIWKGEAYTTSEGAHVKLNYLSPAGEEGYPGNLDVDVIYTLTNDNEFIFEIEATTDEPTILNITNHNYYNLTGGKKLALDHELMINGDKFLPQDDEYVPTGEIRSVEGTPMDFTTPTKVGERIDADYGHLGLGYGYNPFYFTGNTRNGVSLAATAYAPSTSILMKVFTDQPGLVFYSAGFLDGSLEGKGGQKYEKYDAICLETQYPPDDPNNPNFPSDVLHPGEIYETKTVFKFTAK